jgi:protein involved in sex pheromone biosynthesis
MHCLNDESMMSKTSTLGLLDLGNQQHRSTAKTNRRVKPHTRYLTGTAVQESFQKAVLYYTQARALGVMLTL